MRVWVVNPFDPIPGEAIRPGRYARLGEELARRGHEVTWWSSNFFHALKTKRSQGRGERRVAPNFRIVLLPTLSYATNVSLRRVWSHAMFGRQFVRATRTEPPPDLIVASYPPLETGMVAVRYWPLPGTRVVIDVQDLWPESFETLVPRAVRGVARLALAPIRRAARIGFRRAAAIMGVSDEWVRYGLARAEREVPALVAPLGVDVTAFDGGTDGSSLLLARDRTASFVGTIGRGYDLGTVVEAAAMMRTGSDRIVFRIAGEGPDLPALRRAAARRGLDNVRFEGLMPFAEITALLRRSMVGLNVISRGTRAPLGNKLFDYLAAGLPILNSSPGEAAALVEEERIGVSCPAGDPRALVKGLTRLLSDRGAWEAMSVRARRLAATRYDIRRIYPRIADFLEALTESRPWHQALRDGNRSSLS